MTNIFIVLILTLLFAILYGYYQFSNSITETLIIKEGLDNILPPKENTVEIALPQLKSKNYSIATEAGFRDYINDIYFIINNGQTDNTLSEVLSIVEINKNAMIFISKYSYILSEIDQLSFETLNQTYPNMIKTMYDVKELNKLYYAYIVINKSIQNINKPNSNDINYVVYNSLLGYLNSFYDSIVYFNKKIFAASPQIVKTKIGNDINTHYVAKPN